MSDDDVIHVEGTTRKKAPAKKLGEKKKAEDEGGEAADNLEPK